MRKVVIFVVLVLISSLFAPVANAEPARQQRSGTSAVDVTAHKASVWTTERMNAAEPHEIQGKVPARDKERPEATAPPKSIEPRLPANGAPGVRPLVNATPTTGKAFFHNPNTGRDAYCTASAINSGNLRQIITAAHCVHTGPDGCYGNSGAGQWMTDFEFVPLYWQGDRPYGTFQARTLRTFDAWRLDCDIDYDVAIVTTFTNEQGQLLVNAVGGNGLRMNYPGEFASTTFGYPGNRDGGETPWVCQGTTTYSWPFIPRPTLYCAWTGGFSGGPWLMEYSDDTLLGYVNGVGSLWTGDENNPEWIDTPYFDNMIESIYNDAAGD
jgi:hypothetical protein